MLNGTSFVDSKVESHWYTLKQQSEGITSDATIVKADCFEF